MKSFFYDLCKFYNDSRSFSLSQARRRIAGHYFSVTPHLIFFFHNKHNQHVTAQYTSFANVCAIFLLPLLKLNFLRCSIVDKKQLSSPKHYWKWVILNPLHPSKLKPLLPMVLLTGLPFHVKHDMLIKKNNLDKNYTTYSTETFWEINYELKKDEMEGYILEN